MANVAGPLSYTMEGEGGVLSVVDICPPSGSMLSERLGHGPVI